MKKFSVSLIAILAIVVATTSAFTTKSKFIVDRWERFGVSSNTVLGTANASTVYASKLSDAFALTSSTQILDITTEQTNYNNAHPAKPVSCASNTTYICDAIVKYDHNTPSTKTLVDFDFGDYSIVP